MGFGYLFILGYKRMAKKIIEDDAGCTCEASCNIDSVNFLNSIFILIVLLLHHGGYTTNYVTFLSHYRITLVLQKLAVGGFVFLSGFKLALSKISVPLAVFLRERFLRIHLLYVIALTIFSFTAYPRLNDGQLPNLANFCVHMVGMQSVFPDLFQPNYYTLWYVSVLYLCYVFFMISRRSLERPLKFILIVILTVASVVVFRKIGDVIELKIFQRDLSVYIALFGFGMISSRILPLISKCGSTLLLVSTVFGFLVLTGFYNLITVNTWYESSVEFVLIMMGTIPFYWSSLNYLPRIRVSRKVALVVGRISYVSFCVFLFHRSVWAAMTLAWDNRSFGQWLFIVPVGLVVIFSVCYWVQRAYDYIGNSMYSVEKH